MTVPLSNQGGQANAGLMQNRPDTELGTNVGLGMEARNGNARREDPGEMAKSAAFSLQLAGARAAAALGSDDENDLAVVAAPPPPPVIFGLEAETAADPVQRRADLAGLAQSLVNEIAASDRIRLGGNGPVTLSLPLNAPALGLSEARLVVAQGEVSIVFPMRAGADPTVVNAALAELAQLLAQRFPARTIRLRGEDAQADRADPAEFNPFKEPVGRRK